jgi:limonene-1,2-epoxide hydrolase
MPPLYFLHIPKTSGTTLTAYLDAHFQPHEIVGPKVWSQHLAELGPAGRSPFTRSMRGKKLIRGHFGRGVWRELDETPSVITMLRDPVEKVISMFHHMSSERRWNNFATSDFYRDPYSLDAVMGDDRARILSNHQVRHLGVDIDVKAVARSGENAYLARLDHEPPVPINLDPLPQFTQPDLEDGALFDSAWDYLQGITFFGLQEYHQASVLLLADTLGWQPIKVANRLMTIDGRPARSHFDEAVIAGIMANNELDAELYGRARQLFLSRYSALASRVLGERLNHLDLAEHEAEITDRCLQDMLRERPAKALPAVSVKA